MKQLAFTLGTLAGGEVILFLVPSHTVTFLVIAVPAVWAKRHV